MTDKIYVLANDDVADECMLHAMNWHLAHPKFNKASEQSIKIVVAAVSEYLANQKGFTMYRDVATYPKEKDNG